ncbi:DNA polymerase [Corynebacterium kozikiae]|uniref:DNA polymerase n=1 Tax=Corynebacterium kozikiae TaxID=2968469 RepID=UPI00211C5D81|nr:DNA polymerase [Corynebacterium sp. 76QC2CO]MCQ9343839.1 DNA polymerase [Corynebacterium sp. 76QC2CO]
MHQLSIDIESYGPEPLSRTGVYRYAEHPEFQLLLFAYSIDHAPVQVVDIANGEQLPSEVVDALFDTSVVKSAFNATFERICISAYLRKTHPELLDAGFLDPRGWQCSMVWAATLGLPQSLDQVAQVLGLQAQKMVEGKKLISKFSVPNRKGQQTTAADDPTSWLLFKQYCSRDVEVELELQSALSSRPVPASEWETYWLDQTINDRGILIDRNLADNAVVVDDAYRERRLHHARRLTGLENPNSPIQLKEWLAENGCELESLTKDAVAKAQAEASGVVAEVLELRGELSRSSVKKYQAMQNVAGGDNRARGLIQFYGAGRTGRFAGRLIQVQNLPRNYLPDLAEARALVSVGDGDALELLYPSVPDTLSQLVRTAFIPKRGCRFVVADFSAIEARVIAWLAGEDWRLELFEQGGDIYCQSASEMFGVPVEKHGPNAELRQKGKIAELACGYGGSVGALKAMGALDMGLKENELKPLVDAWRSANPAIVKLWWELEAKTIEAIQTRTPQHHAGLIITATRELLTIQLPSGRKLAYQQPKLEVNQFGRDAITYMGLTPSRKWGKLETYGGKLTENVVQAIARDLLTHALHNVSRAGHEIVMHVHDEIVVETASATVTEICELMSQTPKWAVGLPLTADGYECGFYQKD